MDNLQDFAMLVVAQRALNMPADGNPGKTPQMNGADNTPREKQPNPAGDRANADGQASPTPMTS